ncbi:MAG: SDR family oxidoreductase [Gemmataceae bacterium]|nr:SDR family oxidoreductase [Gemmataceae bacterium]
MQAITPVPPTAFTPNRLAGKVLLVTGAAVGSIGGCAAIRGAREGASVMCVDRKVTELHETVREITSFGGTAVARVADVAKTADAENMVAECVRRFGKLDLALNAAGVMDGTDPAAPPDFANQKSLLPAAVHEATDEYWNSVLSNNLTSMFLSMRAELRQMVAQKAGGSIVNIGSIAGLTGLPGNPAYSASKHAVIGLTRNAAIDYAPHGIRVNSVNMAQTDTPMVFRAYEFVKWAMAQGAGSSMAGAKAQSLLQMADPDKRGSTPWEQAAIILFLLSDDASNLTGLAMATDGGWTAY